MAHLESDMQMLHMDVEIAADEGLQAAEAMIKARDEEIQVAVARAQAAEEQEQIAKKEMEEVRTSRIELIEAHGEALEKMEAELGEIRHQIAEIAQNLTDNQKGGSSPVDPKKE
jgi:hypothetical protein